MRYCKERTTAYIYTYVFTSSARWLADNFTWLYIRSMSIGYRSGCLRNRLVNKKLLVKFEIAECTYMWRERCIVYRSGTRPVLNNSIKKGNVHDDEILWQIRRIRTVLTYLSRRRNSKLLQNILSTDERKKGQHLSALYAMCRRPTLAHCLSFKYKSNPLLRIRG